MRVFYEKRFWASIIAIATVTLTNPALAQNAIDDTENLNDRPALGPSEAETSTIVVTANKREQSLSDVGLTIAAMSREELARQRISDVRDLAKVTPGLAFAPTANSTPVYTLRGVGFFETTLSAYPDV